MHIALDLRMVGPQLHGIARYALELSRRLPHLAPESKFDLVVSRDFDESLLGQMPPNVRFVPAKSAFLSPAEQVELPLLLKRLKPDLYHSPSFSVPIGYCGPLALTIHDANHLVFPEHYGRLHGYYYRHVVRPGALRARLVLTVSYFAQREIERRLRIPQGRVRVVYNGVDARFRPFPEAEVEAFRRERGLPDRFVLYVGNTKPHKNLGLLLDAFARLGGDLSLVICAGPRANELLRRSGLPRSRVQVLESLSDAELPLLYAAARVFAFPSLYEGFGLPPLEAMACGTPTVVSRAASLPEVVGDAAALVEPGDAQDLADAIARVDSDEEYAKGLRQAGFARAKRFSWDATAATILEAYRCNAEPLCAPAVPGPRGPQKKILFCVRSNLWSLTGGDATQILRTQAALETRGVHVTLWAEPRPPRHGSFDLAHLFHLSRLDTYVHAQSLAAEGMPFVLSTIYWPTDEFERRGYIGALKLLHKALSGTPADLAKNGVRALLADGDWRWALLPDALLPLEQRIEYLVRQARCLLPNSEAEADVLRKFGATQIRPVVNAADPPPAQPVRPRVTLPERFLLCAGRIEPRKNQLALVEALRESSLPLVLVGDAGPMHHDYYRRVRAAADGRAILLPAHPREELFALYAAAEAHIAPAWYETPGLVSLEAAAAGTRVITTDRGSTREYFGNQAVYLDPGDQTSMRAAVETALALPRDPDLTERVLSEFTWERAGDQTLEAYEQALASPEAEPVRAKAS